MALSSRCALVVGAGPAGLTAAYEMARAGVRVLLVEKAGFGGARVGEHIGPATVQHLKRLGLGEAVDPQDHLVCSGIDAWWGSSTPSHNDYLFQPAAFGLNLSRPQFDASLAQLCRLQGVRILAPARVVRASHSAGVWDLEIEADNELTRQRTRYVVDASGRTASFARMQGAGSSMAEKQIAVFGVANRATGPHPQSARVVIESTRTGWWYLAPMAKGRCVCMFVTDPRNDVQAGKRLEGWWKSQLQETVHVSRTYSDDGRTDALRVRSTQSRCLDQLQGPGWLAIGDAAMTFDPLSSQGIAKAVEEGSAAASAICSHFEGDELALARHAAAAPARYAEYLSARTSYYRLEQRWTDAEFWRTRQAQLP